MRAKRTGRRVCQALALCHVGVADAGKPLKNCWQCVNIKDSSCCGRTSAPQVHGAARVMLRPKRPHVLALRTHSLRASVPGDASYMIVILSGRNIRVLYDTSSGHPVAFIPSRN